jgi:oxalate decarboxylase/phosphoglucose isomerase-like protein (cupin superfamily)
MSVHIANYKNALKAAKFDKMIGLKIAVLLESEERCLCVTELAIGASSKPHYHKFDNDEYHILSGNGFIRLAPINMKNKSFTLIAKEVKDGDFFIIPPNMIHQLINRGNKPLILVFSCPKHHLGKDRIIIENLEEILSE